MKRAGQLLATMLLTPLATAVWGQQTDVPRGYQTLDMRDGLAESRIRQIKQMPDGRMAIATSGTIDIYDGTRFQSYRLPPGRAYPLTDYHGNRQLTCDVAGRVWLRNEQTLYVVDTQRGEVVADVDSLLHHLGMTAQGVAAWPKSDTPSEYQGIKEVMAMERDCYGGLWIGTKESGILYSNALRLAQFHTSDQPFTHPRKPNHATARTRRLEAAYAPQATNCMLDDSTDAYAYLGTTRGVMVFDAANRHVATLDEQDGLHTANVQALIHDRRGRVWASTSTGITRISHQGRDSFDIVNYGRLDGIRVEGREFRPGQIYQDSTGHIAVGFVGGTVLFHPDSVTAPRYTFHFPRHQLLQQEALLPHLWRAALVVCIALIMALAGVLTWKRRKKQTVRQRGTTEHAPQASDEAVSKLMQAEGGPTSDKHFLNRLHQLVEQNVANADFSIQMLSEQMTMDRTGLYRRVQALTGMSPSAYVRSIRMDMAARLLRESSLPIADIALCTGFSTTKYFNRVFKEEFGTSPADYRGQGKGGDEEVRMD